MSDAEKVVEILKSGDFTIAYHGKNYCSLYKGKYEYDDLPEQEDCSFDNDYFDGYTPEILFRLIQALNGKSVSI